MVKMELTMMKMMLMMMMVTRAVLGRIICVDFPSPNSASQRVMVDCTPLGLSVFSQKKVESVGAVSSVSNDTTTTTSFGSVALTGLASPVESLLSLPELDAPLIGINQTNMFTFDLDCKAPSSQTCTEANKTLYEAGQLISNVLSLSALIHVNATMAEFEMSTTGTSESNVLSLAAAAPARTIPLVDSDGVTRLYPQAVVKQFSSTSVNDSDMPILSPAPVYSLYDINLNINAAASFYFSSSSSKAITSSQSDFLFVAMHELIHGLGFSSSYEDYIHASSSSSSSTSTTSNQTTITPNILISYDTSETDTTTTVTFSSFIEYAFDRFLYLNTPGVMATDVVKQLNTLFPSYQSFESTEDLTDAILGDNQLLSTSQSLSNNFTTINSTTFMSPSSMLSSPVQQSSGLTTNSSNVANDTSSSYSTLLVLETSLNPFSPGSSISHVSALEYTDTPDFLMRYTSQKGITLAQYIESGRGDKAYGAIGPGLRGVLGGLGYRIRGGLPTSDKVVHNAGSESTNGSVQSVLSSNASSLSVYDSLPWITSCIFVIGILIRF